MTTTVQRVPWLSIALGGIAAFVVSFIGSFLVVSVYAFSLGMKARGAPDPAKISAFASEVIPVLGPLLLSLLVIIAAYRVVRRARAPQLWQGVLVGVVAVIPSLIFMGAPNPVELGGLLLPPSAGLLGGYFALRRARVSLS